MFAILFTKGMDPFYDIFFSFPTIIFSFLVALSILFSLVAMLGFIDLDFLDLDLSADGADGLDGVSDNLSNANVLAGFMMRFGLAGVPFVLIMPTLFIIAWLISFTASYYLYDFIPDGILQIFVGLVLFFITLYVSAFVTGKVLKPFRGLFQVANQEVQKEIVGRVGIVRTSSVTKTFGEATVSDGGAGLIVKIRAYKGEEFKRGDRIVLLEYMPEESAYKVISEEEFNN